MTIRRNFLVVCCLFGLVACGSSKNGFDSGPAPQFGRRHKPTPDKDTLTLKTESLKLTHITQTWKLNALNQNSGAEKYLRVQKTFPFPIQFNGWVTLDNVTHISDGCDRGVNEVPEFILEDDHNGYVVLKAGDRIHVSLEKLYDLVVEFPNQGLCKSVDVQFGVLYGTND
jgi:hypothetical protein